MYNKNIFQINPFLRALGKRNFNMKEYLAQIKKPPYSPRADKIILDITYACNLNCVKCNRSCRYAPSDDFMNLSQIEHFLNESIEYNRKWKQIWIEGGEPTLNPDLENILKLLLEYKKKYNPSMKIQLNSNGYGKETIKKLKEIGKYVKIYSSDKTSPDIKDFCVFNLAPCDFEIYKDIDYSIGCYFPSFYGLSLNMNGYYYCSNAGGIDRVLGLDIGLKKLPIKGEIWWKKQMSELCKYCGHFQINNSSNLSIEPPNVNYNISDSWRNIYNEFNSQKISLTKY